jgi:benzoyl-CoA reductase/2-hydroxyglutaryl-CoA dehydratase subunit BcrC/BadD/HgdB
MQYDVDSRALREFREAAATLVNPELEEWKSQGGKVIGCMYHFVPEELITAAGLLPYRMRATGSTGTELSESRFTQVNCSFVRHLFDSGMRRDQSFLDGVVSVNNCDHIRRLYDNWRAKIPAPYMHFLVFPKKSGPEQVEAYRNELAAFRKSLEEHFEVEITEEKLQGAIKLHNETRRLQRQLYDLRKSDAPPITGADALAVMVAGTCIPRERYNSLLRELIEERGQAEGHKGHVARLMVVGGEIDDPGFLKAIESQNGLVVADLLGYGYRSCMKDVSTESDPLTALARYQVMDRPADPRIFGRSTQERDEYLSKLVEEFSIDGIISVRLMQCDHWGFEQVNLSKYLKKRRIPHLALETEYVPGGVGQIKTRVQAFLESITEARNAGN